MDPRAVTLVCFSPTGRTKAVLGAVARGLGREPVELFDITKPAARIEPLQISEDELLVLAVPVYMGRVPALLSDWLNAVRAQRTPTVCVVVYGNRAFDNALLELGDVLTSRGCALMAGAAFVGEHAFSSSELPTAPGRPDTRDRSLAADFGQRVSEKLRSASSVDDLVGIELPGSRPYGGVTELWSVDFVEVSDRCTDCGICSDGCPVGAIDPEDSRVIDTEKCITCCACIKNCPEGARTMKAGPVKDAAIRLHELYGERKEPAWFL